MTSRGTEPDTPAEAFRRAYGGHDGPIALYGTSPATQDILRAAEGVDIVGILDGFRSTGEVFGLPVLTLETLVERGVTRIVVVARASSTRLVVGRIAPFCRAHGIRVTDVSGQDLLATPQRAAPPARSGRERSEELEQLLERHEVVSFDVFDTLLTRTLLTPQDVFEVMEDRLSDRLPAGLRGRFAQTRIEAERQIATGGEPTLAAIYDYITRTYDVPAETAEAWMALEVEVEAEVLIPRQSVARLLARLVAAGKDVYLVSDMYLPGTTIERLLRQNGITGWRSLLASSDYGVSKRDGLFSHLTAEVGERPILHIGDNPDADGRAARAAGLSSFLVSSGAEMLSNSLAAPLLEGDHAFPARLVLGGFVAEAFNDPLDTELARLTAPDAPTAARRFIAPLIAVLTAWIGHESARGKAEAVLFLARDGYLLKTLYDRYQRRWPQLGGPRSVYFLTSRAACVSMTVRDEDDIRAAWGAGPEGEDSQAWRVRLPLTDITGVEQGWPSRVDDLLDEHGETILAAAQRQRDAVSAYAALHGLRPDAQYDVVDFVASGTCQLLLGDVTGLSFHGLYAAHLADADERKARLDVTALFASTPGDCEDDFLTQVYPLVEAVLGSMDGSFRGFAPDGSAQFLDDPRTAEAKALLASMHEAIEQYWAHLVPLLHPRRLPDVAAAAQLADGLLRCLGRGHSNSADLLADLGLVRDDFFGRDQRLVDVL